KQPYEGYYDPYGLVFFNDTLYLVADSHYNREKGTRESVVSLKVARISRVEMVNRTFEKKPGIDFESRLAGALGVYTGGRRQEYRIRLSAFAARLIAESPWHASQKLAPEGSSHYILSLTLDNAMELTPRLLALGA
ncbi:MAG: WYL domain-containing protein, partial [Planctomycetota bacterium]|nr:WYL domain-containing protein [Planctomycetota bacterium]